MSRTSDRRYLRRRANLKRQEDGDICALCHQPIDLTLKFPDPWSWTADHITPVALTGDNLSPIQPAHLKCNRDRGDERQERSRVRHGRIW